MHIRSRDQSYISNYLHVNYIHAWVCSIGLLIASCRKMTADKQERANLSVDVQSLYARTWEGLSNHVAYVII
jgi:hypothetical protein